MARAEQQVHGKGRAQDAGGVQIKKLMIVMTVMLSALPSLLIAAKKFKIQGQGEKYRMEEEVIKTLSVLEGQLCLK